MIQFDEPNNINNADSTLKQLITKIVAEGI